MKNNIAVLFGAAAGICLLAGCAGHKQAPIQSGFLSQYHHMTPVDATTSRYVDVARLSSYKKFQITSVEVLVKNYDGAPTTADQKKSMADYVRSSIIYALQDKYSVVDAPSTDTAQLRVAIIDAYKSGSQLGISVEGEIQDSFSAVQVAAVIRTDLGPVYVGKWWDKTSARETVNGWAQRLRQAIDSAHAR